MSADVRRITLHGSLAGVKSVRHSRHVASLIRLAALLVAIRTGSAMDLRFVREDLRFAIAPRPAGSDTTADLEVEAVYAFRNTGPRAETLRIAYPVARSDDMGPPEYRSARLLPEDEEPKEMALEGDRLRLSLELEPGQERLLAICYRQPVIGGRFTYLVTTARGWGRPIEEAHFLLDLPPGVVADSSSYRPDGCRSDESGMRCLWTILDFVPEHEFVVWFRIDGRATGARDQSTFPTGPR